MQQSIPLLDHLLCSHEWTYSHWTWDHDSNTDRGFCPDGRPLYRTLDIGSPISGGLAPPMKKFARLPTTPRPFFKSPASQRKTHSSGAQIRLSKGSLVLVFSPPTVRKYLSKATRVKQAVRMDLSAYYGSVSLQWTTRRMPGRSEYLERSPWHSPSTHRSTVCPARAKIHDQRPTRFSTQMPKCTVPPSTWPSTV